MYVYVEVLFDILFHICIFVLQCINQILNRVTTKENMFDKVVADRQPGNDKVILFKIQ